MKRIREMAERAIARGINPQARMKSGKLRNVTPPRHIVRFDSTTAPRRSTPRGREV